MVTVTGVGEVLVDKRPLPFDEVGLAVAERLRRPGVSGVVVNAEGTAQHQWLVCVYDELRAQGIGQVMIGAEETREREP